MDDVVINIGPILLFFLGVLFVCHEIELRQLRKRVKDLEEFADLLVHEKEISKAIKAAEKEVDIHHDKV